VEADFEVQLTEDGTGVIVYNYVGKATTVHIPATIQGMPVKGMGRVFLDNAVITSVVIPEGVVKINGRAFTGCRNLTSVTLPESL
jgi:hypothetical protein